MSVGVMAGEHDVAVSGSRDEGPADATEGERTGQARHALDAMAAGRAPAPSYIGDTLPQRRFGQPQEPGDLVAGVPGERQQRRRAQGRRQAPHERHWKLLALAGLDRRAGRAERS